MPVRVRSREYDPAAVLARMREVFDVDPPRGAIRWKRSGENAGCAGGVNPPYWQIALDGRKWLRSWLVFLWVNGRWPSHHIDGNSLNDASHNLREATVYENAWNHRRKETGLKYPRGVRKRGKGFHFDIMKHGERRFFGGYKTPEEAHAGYLAKRRELFGEFA